jgi:hypothetical protein
MVVGNDLDCLQLERDAVHLSNRLDLSTGAKLHTIIWIDYGHRTATIDYEVEGQTYIILQTSGIISIPEAEAITGWCKDKQEAEWRTRHDNI